MCAHAASSPQRVAAVQHQVVPGHVGGRIRRQQHDRRLQVGDLRQAPGRDLRQPLLAQRPQRIRLLRAWELEIGPGLGLGKKREWPTTEACRMHTQSAWLHSAVSSHHARQVLDRKAKYTHS